MDGRCTKINTAVFLFAHRHYLKGEKGNRAQIECKMAICIVKSPELWEVWRFTVIKYVLLYIISSVIYAF